MTEEERDVLRWGRNSGAVNVPKSVDSKAYKKATALEVLVSVVLEVGFALGGRVFGECCGSCDSYPRE